MLDLQGNNTAKASRDILAAIIEPTILFAKQCGAEVEIERSERLKGSNVTGITESAARRAICNFIITYIIFFPNRSIFSELEVSEDLQSHYYNELIIIKYPILVLSFFFFQLPLLFKISIYLSGII